MADFNLKMIKIFFVVVIAMLILAMTSGMSILRGAQFVDWKKIAMEWDYIKYKNALASGEKENSLIPPNDRRARSIPVLLYHGIITDHNWEEDGTNVTLADFREQMFALKKSGYHTITISEFYEYMQGKKDLPEKSIMITFDDGRKDSYAEADPLLKALDYNAVMFLITGRSLGKNSAGDNFYLGKNDLEDMIASKRWEIQSHGDSDHGMMQIDAAGAKGHFMSNLLWQPDQQRNESEDETKQRILSDLQISKKKIEGELGQKVYAFAYPFNDYGQQEQNFPGAEQFIKENIGKIYPLTLLQVENDDVIGNYPDPNQLFIKRVNVDSAISAAALLQILDQNKEKELPYSDSFWDNKGWISRWGKVRVWGDLLIGDNDGEKSGNLTVLLGTKSWQNYAFKADFILDQGNSLSQVVRYQDEENYISCNFSDAGVSIIEKDNGNDITLAEQPSEISNISRNSDNQIETDITGNQVSCFLNGGKAVEAQISQKNANGGVGFYIWDDLPETTTIRIKKIETLPL